MNLKVGDIVRITITRPIDQGVGPNPYWVQGMDDCLGKIGKIYAEANGNYRVTVEGDESTWYYAPHWLTKIEFNTIKSLQLLLI